MAFKDWSETAANNDDADATINWLEGQAPSTVNGSARSMMAVLKKALGHIVSIKDFGAVGDGVTDDTAAVQAALDTAQQVLVPAGVFLVDELLIPSNTRLFGVGWTSILRYATNSPGDNWVGINNAQYVIVENLRFDGNQSVGPKTAGAGLYVANTEIAFVPRRNYVIIRNCRVDVPGFVGIYTSNAHNVIIDSNYVTGTRDSAIAVNVGSSAIQVTNNWTSGCDYGISLSSNGNTDIATTGPVRQVMCEHNFCFVDKASSVGIELDGLERSVVQGNTCEINGGAEGIRVQASGQASTATDIDVYDCVIADNIVDFKANNASTGFNIGGTGDISSTRIENNNTSSLSAKTLCNGLLISNGVKVSVGGHTSRNVNNGIEIDQNNVASTIWLRDCVVKACTIGLQAPDTYANKTSLYLVNCDITGCSTANFSIASGFNLTFDNTPISSYADVSPNNGVEWPLDLTDAGNRVHTITAAGTYNLGTGSGLVLVHNNSTGDAGLFLIYAGGVTKVSGAASIVAGAAGGNQIGLAYTGAVYQLSNGYATSQGIFVGGIRSRNQN